MLIDWLRIGTRLLDQRLEHDIQKECRSSFCLFYWLFCSNGHTFISALLELLAWLLVERSPGVEKSLLASPNTPYQRCWSTSRGVWLPIKAPKYFLLLGSPSKKQDSRGLAFGRLPTGRRPRCWWLLWPHTTCYLLPQILFLALAELYLLAHFWWYPAPAVTLRIYYVSSTL